MVGLIDVKRKGSALVGHWVQYMTLTFELTHDLDLGCFKVKFPNSSISGIVGLIDVKWKGSELIWYWVDCMTLPFDHTHDLDLGVSRSESEIALSQEWGGRLIMNEKDVSHPFMTMILTCVTMVRWEDVADSDRGDFRRLVFFWKVSHSRGLPVRARGMKLRGQRFETHQGGAIFHFIRFWLYQERLFTFELAILHSL